MPLLAGVYQHVLRQRVLLAEALPADLAPVRLLARVRQHVHRQGVLSGEALPAGVAPVSPFAGVRQRVLDQAVLEVERLPAGRALVAPLVVVYQHVFRQARSVVERFAARRAFVLLLAGVYRYVVGKGVLLSEALHADSALVRLSVEAVRSGEEDSADFASPRGFRCWLFFNDGRLLVFGCWFRGRFGLRFVAFALYLDVHLFEIVVYLDLEVFLAFRVRLIFVLITFSGRSLVRRRITFGSYNKSIY